MKKTCDSMNPPVSQMKKLSYQTEHVGTYQIQREIVYMILGINFVGKSTKMEGKHFCS